MLLKTAFCSTDIFKLGNILVFFYQRNGIVRVFLRFVFRYSSIYVISIFSSLSSNIIMCFLTALCECYFFKIPHTCHWKCRDVLIGNHIRPDGAKALACALQVNKTVNHIHISIWIASWWLMIFLPLFFFGFFRFCYRITIFNFKSNILESFLLLEIQIQFGNKSLKPVKYWGPPPSFQIYWFFCANGHC